MNNLQNQMMDVIIELVNRTTLSTFSKDTCKDIRDLIIEFSDLKNIVKRDFFEIYIYFAKTNASLFVDVYWDHRRHTQFDERFEGVYKKTTIPTISRTLSNYDLINVYYNSFGVFGINDNGACENCGINLLNRYNYNYNYHHALHAFFNDYPKAFTIDYAHDIDDSKINRKIRVQCKNGTLIEHILGRSHYNSFFEDLWNKLLQY